MDVRSIIRLVQGLSVQALCYAGIFLSLTVGARALNPTDFGIYASSVAIASFAGSVLTAGLDRILLKVLLQEDDGTAHGRVRLSLFLPAIVLNLLVLTVVAVLSVVGVTSSTLLFIATLGGLVAARLTLSGFFKYALQNYTNVVATFSLQPLIVGGLFSVLLLVTPDAPPLADLRCWILVTLVVEAVQFAILLVRARAGGLARADEDRGAILPQSVEHAKAGAWISLLVLLSQTGLFGLSLGSLLLPPADMGVYTVALRLSQLLLFPVIGATQLLVPISARSYEPAAMADARREARHMLRVGLACLIVAIIGFALLGPMVLRLVLNVSDPRAYYCTLILSFGNLGMAVFGVGDQIMVALGRHVRAFWISFWCGGVLFLALASLIYLLGYGLIGLACATAAPIAARAVFGYLNARRLVAMPIAVFDR
jgi:O-antigen/teichoic acid export membrane protein